MKTIKRLQGFSEVKAFRLSISKRLVDGSLEFIRDESNTGSAWTVDSGSVFHDTQTAEYFQLVLSYQDGMASSGYWNIVRELHARDPLHATAEYRFNQLLGGSYGLFASVCLNVIHEDWDKGLSVNII